ncbi:uncharacterized protein PG998_013221 [Apiospora kogelbergensis]|uniref:uncharacterized protein n=1 Tax=Apiospora kogelbergensis TaxID=1337665 RepID=UPI003130EF8E
MMKSIPSHLLLLSIAHHAAAFNLYPSLNADKLGKALGIATDCLQALNRTMPNCDQTLLGMVADFENFWWEDDNVTALCSGNCALDVSSWSMDLYSICYGEYISAYGKQLPASSIGERLNDGMNLMCLPSYLPLARTTLAGASPSLSTDREATGDTNGILTVFCSTDCTANPSDPACGGNASAIPVADMRMANLYDDDTLCNDCFIEMLYQRVTSSLLSDEDHSDYLVDQLQDIGDICSTSIRDFTLRAVPTGSGCNGLATKYGVTTGDLQAATNSSTCQVTAAICLPATCTLQQVISGQTCDNLASSFKATTVQFLAWNPSIMGLCDSPTPGHAPGTNISYALPPPPLGTSADAGNQQRGGAGGVVVPTTTVSGTITDPASHGSGSAPSPTQDGLASDCNNFASVKAGDNCVDWAKAHGVTPGQLYACRFTTPLLFVPGAHVAARSDDARRGAGNPVLGLNGANCSTHFWASEYYCIGVRPTPTAPVTAPGATQSGVAPNCNKYAQAQADDGCEAFAARHLISAAQLYAWNAVLGPAGQNCRTSLWAAEWYCVGISAPHGSGGGGGGPTTTTTTTTRRVGAAPGPTQTGIVANCAKVCRGRRRRQLRRLCRA